MRSLQVWPKLVAAILLLEGGAVMHGQKALIVNPGGAVIYKNATITMVDVKVSGDEKTFTHEGRSYPFGGQSYWAMEESNRKKYNILDHIKIVKGKLLFDGVVMDVGGPVEQVYQALNWGDSVACLGFIPHTPKAWWEAKKAHAVLVFSPKEKRGGYLGLTLAGKVNYQLSLIDPIEHGK
jgi:hypothetical protein